MEGPPIPEGAEGLWRLFSRLNVTRTSNGFGPNPISYSEIEAMSRTTGIPVSSWEVDVIRQMDMAFLVAMVETKKAKAKT